MKEAPTRFSKKRNRGNQQCNGWEKPDFSTQAKYGGQADKQPDETPNRSWHTRPLTGHHPVGRYRHGDLGKKGQGPHAVWLKGKYEQHT
jgi:hypothetical protein